MFFAVDPPLGPDQYAIVFLLYSLFFFLLVTAKFSLKLGARTFKGPGVRKFGLGGIAVLSLLLQLPTPPRGLLLYCALCSLPFIYHFAPSQPLDPEDEEYRGFGSRSEETRNFLDTLRALALGALVLFSLTYLPALLIRWLSDLSS